MLKEMNAESNGLQNRLQNDGAAFVLEGVRQVKDGQEVLGAIDLEIASGAVTALVGPSGAGKTSLLRLLNRLDDPVGGAVRFRSRPITEYPIRQLRLQIGFVFQTPMMFPGTVCDNLQIALKLAGKSVLHSDGQINETLALVGLDPLLAEREAERLSVGQKQRVSVARALMTAPEVLLMDEPTSALDPEAADRLMEMIRGLGKEHKITVVMVTHRLSEAFRASDWTIVMEGGRILETGSTRYIFEETANPRIREFLDASK